MNTTSTCEHGRTEPHTYPNPYFGSCGFDSRCDGEPQPIIKTKPNQPKGITA